MADQILAEYQQPQRMTSKYMEKARAIAIADGMAISWGGVNFTIQTSEASIGVKLFRMLSDANRLVREI